LPSERRTLRTNIVAEALDAKGNYSRSRLRSPEAYGFTARCAVRVAQRVLAGEWQAGFRTPSQMYGPDFALSFRGVTRKDL
jgi:hypothetical protein